MTSNITFFHVSASIFTIGITCLSLIIPLVIHQQSSSLFQAFHSCSAGALIGMGFISAIYESKFDLKTDGRLVWLFASTSFLVLLLYENIRLKPKKYSLITQKESILSQDDSQEDVDYANNIELTSMEDQGGKLEESEDQEAEDEVSDEIYIRHNRMNPLGIIILLLSVYGFIRGLFLGSTSHDNYGFLSRYLIQKAIVALGIGSNVADIEGISSSFVTTTTIIYSFADAVGIIIGGLTFKSDMTGSIAYDFLYRSYLLLDGYGAAVAAGLYMYIAVEYMIPVNLDVNRLNIDGNRVSSALALVIGYAIASSISLQYGL
jgi:zinc transporter ZupT